MADVERALQGHVSPKNPPKIPHLPPKFGVSLGSHSRKSCGRPIPGSLQGRGVELDGIFGFPTQTTPGFWDLRDFPKLFRAIPTRKAGEGEDGEPGAGRMEKPFPPFSMENPQFLG